MRKYRIGEKEVAVSQVTIDGNNVSLSIDGKAFSVNLQNGIAAKVDKHKFHTMVNGLEAMVERVPKLQARGSSSGAEGSIQSPMPGKIFKIIKSEGEELKKGETILIMEAMKMEHAIKAPKDGLLKKILFQEGEQVQGQVDLVEIE
jgi:biotin carboxyl carrier protein